MVLKVRIGLASLLVSLFLAPSFSQAGSPSKGWSAEELALAKQLGLDLSPRGEGLRYRSVAEQTWLCPWVVDGTVERVEEDLYGPYHTKVGLRVNRYIKGTGPTKISLQLRSGRLYSEYEKGVVRAHVVGAVEFSASDVGARFIVFLDKNAPSDPRDEAHFRKYILGENEYRPANRYRIQQDRATPDSEMVLEGPHPGALSFSFEDMLKEILRVAIPQSELSEKTR